LRKNGVFVVQDRKTKSWIQVQIFTHWAKGMQLKNRMLKCWIRENRALNDVEVIQRIEFSAKNFTSNAGLQSVSDIQD
jgi:hypothetical protein